MGVRLMNLASGDNVVALARNAESESVDEVIGESADGPVDEVVDGPVDEPVDSPVDGPVDDTPGDEVSD
jgi:hypothetical protein